MAPKNDPTFEETAIPLPPELQAKNWLKASTSGHDFLADLKPAYNFRKAIGLTLPSENRASDILDKLMPLHMQAVQDYRAPFLAQIQQRQLAPPISQMRQQYPSIKLDPSQLQTTEGPRPYGPGSMEVPALGPGAPVKRGPMEIDPFLQSMSPQELAEGRFQQELDQRGPGVYRQGARPTSLAPTEVELQGPGAPVTSEIPGVKATLSQMQQYQSLLAGHQVDPLSGITVPSVLVNREKQEERAITPKEITYALGMINPALGQEGLVPPESVSPVTARAILSAATAGGDKTEIREMEDPNTNGSVLNLVDKRTGKILATVGPTSRAVNDLIGVEGVRDILTSRGHDPYKTALRAVGGDKAAQGLVQAAQREWQKSQEALKAAATRAEIAAKPMDPRDRDAITIMQEFNRHIQNIKKIPAARLEEYVGKFSMPAHEWAQIAVKDPLFAQFATDLAFLQREFFSDDTAGAALTPLEFNTLRKSIPYGSEWGGFTDFMAKLNESEQRATTMIENRLQLATETRGQTKDRLSGKKKKAPSDFDAKLDAAIKAVEAIK